MPEFETKGRLNQKAWEMYVANFVLQNCLPILRKGGEGPDVKTEIDGVTVWIEATAPDVGEVDAAPERPILQPGQMYTSGGDIETTYRTKVLRMLSAVSKKSHINENSQYSKGIKSGLIRGNDAYIIAINSYAFSGTVSDAFYLLRRSFLAAGCFSFPMQKGVLQKRPFFVPQPFVEKVKIDGTKQNVPSDIFTNDTYSEISAILYSDDHIINAPKEGAGIGDRLYLLRNPYAKNPLPEAFPSPRYEVVAGTGYIQLIDHKLTAES